MDSNEKAKHEVILTYPASYNEKIIMDFYRALWDGDWEKCKTMMAPNCVAREAKCLPYGGDWFGDGCRDVFLQVKDHWGDLKIEHRALVCNEHYGFIYFFIQGKRPDREKEWTQHIVEKISLENGKITEFMIFYQDAKATADWMAGL